MRTARWTFLLLGTGALASLLKRDADFESVRTRLGHSYVDLDLNHPRKYFHEATFHQHYDGRFADKPLKYDEKQSHLSALIQTYLGTMNEIGAETWLMHGTLLGWYWNRKTMPWDSDVDVMVSEESIHLLASYYNMTMHRFKIHGTRSSRDYLLEINPHYLNDTLDKDNRIDGRWIDTETGLFIDVTTLRRNMTAAALGDSDAMMVKDSHHYQYDDIYPLVESVFEDTPVWIPYAHPDILVEEYGDHALSDVYHDNHYFDAIEQAWVPQKLAVLSAEYKDDEGG